MAKSNSRESSRPDRVDRDRTSSPLDEFVAETTTGAWHEKDRNVQPETTARGRAYSAVGGAAPPEASTANPAPASNPRGLFATVADDVAEAPSKPARPAPSLRIIWVAVGVLASLVVGEAIFIVTSRAPVANSRPVPNASSVGTVHVQSTPSGATVLLNGQDRGETPATLLLAAGDYQLEIVRGVERQPLAVQVKAGAESAYQVTLTHATDTGAVRVSSEPPGMAVAIDRVRRGVTPLTVAGLTTGEHTITVFGPGGSMENKVAVPAGGVASVAVTLPASATATTGTMAVGSVSFDAPIELQILEDGKLVGTSRMDRIILPAGPHDIQAVNESLGYSATQRILVAADKTTRVRLETPRANVNINAIPWADVTIDGASMGQTPIGNLPIAIGSHEIVYRHPQLGEQRQTVTVTVGGPNRFSVAMGR